MRPRSFTADVSPRCGGPLWPIQARPWIHAALADCDKDSLIQFSKTLQVLPPAHSGREFQAAGVAAGAPRRSANLAIAGDQRQIEGESRCGDNAVRQIGDLFARYSSQRLCNRRHDGNCGC
jgi:hypothetical protein